MSKDVEKKKMYALIRPIDWVGTLEKGEIDPRDIFYCDGTKILVFESWMEAFEWLFHNEINEYIPQQIYDNEIF